MAAAAIGGAVGGGLVDAFTQGFTAKKQYQKAKYMYKHRYQWTMKDMQRAGLNPILAAGGQPPAPSPGDLRMQTDFGRSIPAAIAQGAQIKQSQAAARNLDASTVKTQQDTENARIQSDTLQAESNKAQIERDKADLELRAAQKYLEEQTKANLEATTARKQADIGAAHSSEAQAKTAGYKGPMGIQIPKAAVDAVRELINHYGGASSAKRQTEGE